MSRPPWSIGLHRLSRLSLCLAGLQNTSPEILNQSGEWFLCIQKLAGYLAQFVHLLFGQGEGCGNILKVLSFLLIGKGVKSDMNDIDFYLLFSGRLVFICPFLGVAAQ